MLNRSKLYTSQPPFVAPLPNRYCSIGSYSIARPFKSCNRGLHERPKHCSFQYLESYIRVLMIFSTRYCGLVPLIDLASFGVRFAIFFSCSRGLIYVYEPHPPFAVLQIRGKRWRQNLSWRHFFLLPFITTAQGKHILTHFSRNICMTVADYTS